MLQIRSIKRFTSLNPGNELSQNEGIGVEFSGLREYTNTDDARLIEWKSSARSQKINMRKFEATTTLQISLVTDIHKKMYFRYEKSKNKYDLMLDCIRSIYDCAFQYGHSLTGWYGDENNLIKNYTDKNIHTLKYKHLAFCEGIHYNFSSLNQYLEKLKGGKTNNSLIILLSDTLTPLDIPSLSHLSKQNDIILIHLLDTYETNPVENIILGQKKISGYFPLQKMDEYLENLNTSRKNIELSIQPYGGYISLSTNDKVIEKLNLFFRTRK